MTTLQGKLEGKTARIAVVGQGYVGLPLVVDTRNATKDIDAPTGRIVRL